MVAVAVVMLVILGVVWSTKQPSSNVENEPAPSAEAVKVNQEAEAAKARQDSEAPGKAQDARLTAVKDVARREAEVAKAKQEADARREAKAEKLRADKEKIALPEAEAKKTLKIGAEYGGGKIAWLDATGQHGLIAAKADLSGGEIYNWEAAKKACRELVNNGYSDWHLPTKEELNKLYHAKSDVGGFADYYY